MYVSSTDFKNYFGKYLSLCKKENVIITKHGKKLAVLLHYPRNSSRYEAGEPVVEYGTSTDKYGIRPRERGSVTYQEFLEMTEKSDNRYELIDGEVYQLASPRYSHQKILGLLFRAFIAYFDEREGCEPFVAPFDIRLFRQPLKEIRKLNEDDTNVVQPDLFVLCDYEKDIDEDDRYRGTPTLAVEILSPSTRSKDMLRKGDLYMESGIREYWLVDPLNSTISVYTYEEYDISSYRIFTAGERAESVLYKGLGAEVSF